MVQILVTTESGAALCRLTMEPTATVDELLTAVELQHPGMRAMTRVLRNDARGTALVLDDTAAAHGPLRQTLAAARLLPITGVKPLETIVVSHHPHQNPRGSDAVGTARPVSSHTYTNVSTAGQSTQLNSASGLTATSGNTNGQQQLQPRQPAPSTQAEESAAAAILRLFAAGGGASTASAAPRTNAAAAAASAAATLPSAPAPAPHTENEEAPPPQQQQQETMVVDEINPELLTPEMEQEQRFIYEQIRQARIDENLVNALEYTPEIFGMVTMLYVPVVINQVPMKAFVDTGAQITIMSSKAAVHCGLDYLIDTRRKGLAVGVGEQKIIGRVHMALVKIAGEFLPFAFDVLQESKLDVIIGLDQLRRHQMVIDLRTSQLIIGDAHVPFLGGSDLPKYEEPSEEETTKEGGEVEMEATIGKVTNTHSSNSNENTASNEEEPRALHHGHPPMPSASETQRRLSDPLVRASEISYREYRDAQSTRATVTGPARGLPSLPSATPSSPAAAAAAAAAARAAAGKAASALTPSTATATTAPTAGPGLPASMPSPAPSAATGTTSSPVASPNASPVEYNAMPHNETERAARIDGFMAFTGITDRVEARRLLEAVGWDPDAAASIFFSVE